VTESKRSILTALPLSTSFRHTVIDAAISIEHSISAVLSTLLDISIGESKTLGNKSSALSFKNKMDLLTDINALNRSDAKLFELFASIRNQFAHNIQVSTMAECCTFIDGLENNLLKKYSPQAQTTDRETQLQHSLHSLVVDLLKSLDLMLKVIEEKGYRAGKAHAHEAIALSMNEVLSARNDGEEIMSEIKRKAEERMAK